MWSCYHNYLQDDSLPEAVMVFVVILDEVKVQIVMVDFGHGGFSDGGCCHGLHG